MFPLATTVTTTTPEDIRTGSPSAPAETTTQAQTTTTSEAATTGK